MCNSTTIPDGYKRCSSCENILPYAEFYRDKTRHDGYEYYCKTCVRRKNRLYKDKNHNETPQYKMCSRCEQIKTRKAFYNDSSSADGLANICTQCKYIEEHGFTIRKVCIKCGEDRPYFDFNESDTYPDGLESVCKSCKNKYYQNRDYSDNARRYYLENRDKLREKGREYYLAHKKDYYIRSAQRRARKSNAKGHHTMRDIALILKSQKYKCWWCGADLKAGYHIDHRIPLFRGGSNNPDNLVASCPYCNLSKATKLPHEWNGRLL